MKGKRPRKRVSSPTRARPGRVYWERVYNQCHEHVRRYMTRNVRCVHDREDLIQDVFANLIAHGVVLETPVTYAVAVARNQLCAHWRKRACGSTASDADSTGQANPKATEMLCGRDSDPHIQLERSERRRQVISMMGSLSPAHAEVLVLRFFKGLDRHEAAVVLGCSTEAIQKRFTRAKHALARCYDDPSRRSDSTQSRGATLRKERDFET